jgi:hypothetical protein
VQKKAAVFRVSAADVIKPAPVALPPLRSFEELGILDSFRKAVEDELSKDEKLVWLGRPSKNPAVYPPKTVLVIIGAGLLVGAVLAVLGGLPLIFPIVIGLLGLLFVAAPKLFNPANTYHACYVVTNRRAMLFERSFRGARGKSWLPQDLLALERRSNDRVPGAGDLIFEYEFVVGDVLNSPGTDNRLRRTDRPERVPRGFFYLDQVREVEDLIRTTLLANLEKKLDS